MTKIATYDPEAKALYIYLIPKDKIKERPLFTEQSEWDNLNIDSQQIGADKWEDVGIEILEVESLEILSQLEAVATAVE